MDIKCNYHMGNNGEVRTIPYIYENDVTGIIIESHQKSKLVDKAYVSIYKKSKENLYS